VPGVKRAARMAPGAEERIFLRKNFGGQGEMKGEWSAGENAEMLPPWLKLPPSLKLRRTGRRILLRQGATEDRQDGRIH